MLTWPWKRLAGNLCMLAAGLSLGLLLSLAWRPAVSGGVREVSPEPVRVWLSVERLEEEQGELKATLAELREELVRHQQAAAASTDRLQALKAELERQRLLAGLTPLQGPGVLVTLDDSAAPVSRGVDANDYIVHDYDVRDIVNLLWMAGSEAIAVNDERLVSSSSIYCLGSTVMVNDTRLSPPYLIRAIGNARAQQEYLRNPSYLKELKERRSLYALRFDVEGVGSMVLPAYSGGFPIEYAQPGD